MRSGDDIQAGRRSYPNLAPNANKSDLEESKENKEIDKVPWCTCGILGRPPYEKK